MLSSRCAACSSKINIHVKEQEAKEYQNGQVLKDH